MPQLFKDFATPASIIISAIILAAAIQPTADQARRLNQCADEWEQGLIETRDNYKDSPAVAKANAVRICNGGEVF